MWRFWSGFGREREREREMKKTELCSEKSLFRERTEDESERRRDLDSPDRIKKSFVHAEKKYTTKKMY